MKKIIDSSLGVVLLIFFFNRCGLPYGLEFSVILAPLFIIYLQQSKLVLKLFLPFYFFIMYSVIHLLQGVIVKDFIVSTFVLFTLLIFTVTFYTYYKKSVAIPDIIKRIAQVNFVLTLLALVSLFSGILFLEVIFSCKRVPPDLVSIGFFSSSNLFPPIAPTERNALNID